MSDTGRLSPEQWQVISDRAAKLHQKVLAIALEKAQVKGQSQESVNFFPVLFRFAATQIEHDVESFCDRADMLFEEIDAFGHEPQLDTDWLQEITGENHSFYFSTDSLVSEMPPLPGRKRGRKPKPPDEKDVIQAVQKAVAQAEDVMAIAHQENPSDWIQKIAIALQEKGGTADFAMLKQTTGLSPGALFLGLLLGQDNWMLRQDTFYGEVIVRCRN